LNEKPPAHHFHLDPVDNQRLAALCGEFNGNLKQIEKHFMVRIMHRGNDFTIVGDESAGKQTELALRELYKRAGEDAELPAASVHLVMQEISNAQVSASRKDTAEVIVTPRAKIRLRNPRQQEYARSVQIHDINFAIGPAGTGKTYLAVACAVEALDRDEVARIVLVRPAVEAGERLGFLPGDLEQKVDPYLRPLYDALFEMLGFERVERLIDKNIIEIAPLAYMRGRTLNDAMAILDEAQNTTEEQMRMFLTRIGFRSRAIITGDITQTDLPRSQRSGLMHAIEVLDGIDGISFNYFEARDVVRHPLVQRIVEAYEKADEQGSDAKEPLNKS
jgi:phosphate starvation-inducible protein PhoH and related proteins